MQRIFCLLTCLIVLAGVQFALAGGDVNGTGSATTGNGNGSDVNSNFDIKDNLDVYQVFESIVEQIMSALQADYVNGQGGMAKPAESASSGTILAPWLAACRWSIICR